MKVLWFSIFLFLALFGGNYCLVYDQVPVMELFTAKIDPQMFNWTYQGVTQQFRYRPSMEGYPDLPSWMRYMYSDEYHAGFLYGTPPTNFANKAIRLEILALNKQTYETRTKTLTIIIAGKVPAANLVQMKIDNLDWVHLMDPGRVENLKNIFRKDLWPSSDVDLHLMFMESAVKMGARMPLRPQQREGVIVHLGSNAPFSERLKELQEEVRPLYKLSTCTYKRTSVQKVFENVGFRLDWCGFRIVGNEISPEVLYHNHGLKGIQRPELSPMQRMSQWNGMHKSEVPKRNYIDELVFSIAIPAMIFAIGIGILSAVLCFHHERLDDKDSENFFGIIFHICEDYWRDEHTKQPTVQMVQCSETSNQPTTTLKSLKDPNLLIDNMSINSQSPCNSLYRNESPRTKTCIRPRPPPYKAPSIGKDYTDI